ncbi:unnamed protein product [Clavelina lepadiformis]|uniref:Uncharacterized protein n=1 Tax=Clavelina lepadiformis TaxID=159417 RepID=A0ABP0G6T0_CLALP
MSAKMSILIVSLFLGSGIPAATRRLGDSGGKEIAPKSAGNELISVVHGDALGYSPETSLFPLSTRVRLDIRRKRDCP